MWRCSLKLQPGKSHQPRSSVGRKALASSIGNGNQRPSSNPQKIDAEPRCKSPMISPNQLFIMPHSTPLGQPSAAEGLACLYSVAAASTGLHSSASRWILPHKVRRDTPPHRPQRSRLSRPIPRPRSSVTRRLKKKTREIDAPPRPPPACHHDYNKLPFT